MNDVPNYKDIAPRLGVAYDLFGNGKTALKATLSRYIVPSTVGAARLLNPFNTTVNNTTRPWTDSNSDGIPQVSELGAAVEQRVRPGQRRHALRSRAIEGFGNRRNNWEVLGRASRRS